MDGNSLTPEQLALEQELLAKPRPEPPASLRERTLVHLRKELRGDRLLNRWSYAVAVSIVILIWANLSISASLATDFHLHSNSDQQAIQLRAAEIQNLLPELSQGEAYRQSLILHASSSVCPVPNIPSSTLQQYRSVSRSIELQNP